MLLITKLTHSDIQCTILFLMYDEYDFYIPQTNENTRKCQNQQHCNVNIENTKI